MTIIITILLILLVIDVIILYSALCVGSDADDRVDRMFKEWEDEQKWNKDKEN